MRICAIKQANRRTLGLVEHETVFAAEGDMFSGTLEKKGAIGNVGELEYLPPVVPTKLVCVGRNYAAHAAEHGSEVPAQPLIFLKPPSSLIGHGHTVELLPEFGRVEHEAELAVVIGKQGRDIPESRFADYVLGYTIANDISERDYQRNDGQWTRAKGFDTFCPLGPWIETVLNPDNLAIRLILNGNVAQDSRTSHMVFNVPTLISFISHIMTLEPGDVILTGTPAGVSPIKPGDTMVAEIEGIGQLSNPVGARA